MIECSICNKDLTREEVKDRVDLCYECHLNTAISAIALELREARTTFEEVVRKLMIEVDK